MGRKKGRVIVWGAGGHGKVIVDALLASNCWELMGIFDDDPRKAGQKILGIPVLDSTGGLPGLVEKLRFDGVAIAIGDNYMRDKKFQEVRECGLKAVNVIHPSAHLSRFVELGEGVTILAGATINPGTVIEDDVCVNTAASVDHDNYLERSCHISPNATLTGGIRVGKFAWVGSGAVVAPNLVINKYSCVAAGAAVVRDVPEGVVVGGVPAAEIGRQPKRPDQFERTHAFGNS
jgi:sugar O-acyltransferase (sialic acid O-acetyltransferase NeuD family)